MHSSARCLREIKLPVFKPGGVMIGSSEAHRREFYPTSLSPSARPWNEEPMRRSTISAAIAVLQGNDSPPPFKFTSKKEALRVLTHYVGDIHQPLHVAAVYLDPAGHVVDPDMGTFNPQTETHGGNDLFIGNKKLHGEWDSISGPFTSDPPTMQVLMKRSLSR
jgi:hypothetical protein